MGFVIRRIDSRFRESHRLDPTSGVPRGIVGDILSACSYSRLCLVEGRGLPQLNQSVAPRSPSAEHDTGAEVPAPPLAPR